MSLATPQRALPGTFFNTPAVNRFAPPLRQPVFSAPSQPARASSNPQSPQSAAPVSQSSEPVQRAARTINEVLQREAGFPDLDSYVRQGISSDYEIPNSVTESAWAPFQRTKTYDIPDALLEQYNHAQASTSMGLWADLNHAYITIDHAIYIWDYTNPNAAYIGYEEQKNQITAVKLVKPKKGVFTNTITDVLVLATTEQIILIGLSVITAGSGVKTIDLFNLHMDVVTRGINIQQIEASAETGRIFFSGADTDVYELLYQSEDKWFSNKTAKINHTSNGYALIMPIWNKKNDEYIVQIVVDDSRRLLYTLSSESSIRTFYMDSPTTLQQVIEKKRQECLRDISHMISASGLLNNTLKIVTINPISAQEGSKLHLMATTSTGCRLFLSATRGYGYSSGQGAPQSMQVQHIKFPPSVDSRPAGGASAQGADPATDTSSASLTSTRIGMRFAPGLFFCFVSKQDNLGVDSLFLSGPDTGRISAEARALTAQASRYYESGCWISMEGRAEDVGLATPPFAAANQPLGFGNELAVQFQDAAAQVAILTNTGVHIIQRRRLVDVFASAIRSGGGDDGLELEVKKFIRQYGRGETTATALAVACGQGSDIIPGDNRIARVNDPETLKIARRAFIEYGGRPSLNENSVSEGLLHAADNVRPSSRHEGLALYMARLIRPLWKTPVIRETILPSSAIAISSPVKSDVLHAIQDELVKLATFLEENKTFIEGLSGPDSLQHVASQAEQVALQGEHQALYSMQKLNSSVIEGISFVQMLFEERVDDIWRILDDSTKQRIRDLSFEALFSTDQGKDLAKILVKAIVNRNIANGSNVDTVADALRRRCGSFCSADDVIIFKAQEQLQKASEPGSSKDMVRNLLNESLRLFQQVAGSLSFQNLQSAVDQFTSLQFFAGAINLSLLVAKESDRGNKAQSWVNEGSPQDDPRVSIYNFRLQCYDLVHRVLGIVDDQAAQQPDVIDGRTTLIATKRIEAHMVINDSDDELFQFNLYDWYLSQGWEHRLLAVDSPFVVQFLTRSAPIDIGRSDLLWKFYVHRENFYEAAAVQLDLAKSEFSIPLAKRIEYLSRAKANASTQSPGIGRQARQILLYEIGELLDVANLQDELLGRLRVDTRMPADRGPQIVQELDNHILNLSVLYNDYADPAHYYDICLMVYDSADHRNAADINATWHQLLEATHMKSANDPGQSQQPYEAVITMIKDMADRLNHSEVTFNPESIITMIEKYAVEYQNNIGPRTWVVDLFIEVNIPFETIVTVLQTMWYSGLAPFSGPTQKRKLADHIVYTCEQWYEDCVRTNSRLYGSDDNAQDISELLGALSPTLSPNESALAEQIRRNIQRSFR